MRSYILSALLLGAQVQAQQPPAFEVASIKPNTTGSEGGSMGARGDSFFADNIPLRNLILYAWTPPGTTMRNAQLIGGPDWTATDRWNIQAKPGGGDHMKEMLQQLLQDRFQLKLHKETRDLPVYNLVPTKRGPKLSEDQTPPDPRKAFLYFVTEGQPLQLLARGALRIVTGPVNTTIEGTAISLSLIITTLQGRSDRIILDQSHITGLIDINLHFSQNPPADAATPAEPALFTALQEIGLKLEAAKAPLPVLIIDSVQHPSEN